MAETRARTTLDAGYQHWLVVPSDTEDQPETPRCIWCEEAGTIVVRDENGVDLPYTLARGQMLIFHAVRILATGTTGTFYAWT